MREKEIESSSFKEADSSYLTPFSIVEAHTVSGWDGLCLFIDLKGGKEAEEGSLLRRVPPASNNTHNVLWSRVRIPVRDLTLN